MQLLEALRILRGSGEASEHMDVFLACGFTPLHLSTFLAAQLQLLYPGRSVQVAIGLYGDAAGNIERLGTPGSVGAVVLEWPDFDPRLGIRQACQWGPGCCDDILRVAEARAGLLQRALDSAEAAIALCLPTLPIAPVPHTAGWRSSAFQLRLQEIVSSLAVWAATRPHLRILNQDRLDFSSPPQARLDVAGDLMNSFPYTIAHASSVAELLARLICNPLPKKGIITDLDDTLWRGLLGEIGPDGISWDLDHQSRIHGLYQQLLAALAKEGTLVAVASKNEASTVEEAFARPDILLRKDAVWPMEVHWGPKSESVRRILAAWRVGADSVVFIDDSPMELAEVTSAHPSLEAIQFPRQDSKETFRMLLRLRDTFGKDLVREEDTIRAGSLRNDPAAHQFNLAIADGFLAEARSEISLSFGVPSDSRALELVNKTNQFNLNGRRYSDADWLRYMQTPGLVVVVAAYQDRFGLLGRIMTLAGKVEGRALSVDTWVLSCRAFSRRIEHRCLEYLFAKFDLDEVVFDFAGTPRNLPVQDFLRHASGLDPEPGLRLSRQRFLANLPPLFSAVSESRCA
jgi:FkbH-like protein